MGQVAIAVVGSVNLDIVATVPRLPAPGETITGGELARYPGGKGANQALAARRLGADVKLVACVGNDAAADEALALLLAEGVDLSGCIRSDKNATGHALIAVAEDGENQIVVAPGANAGLTPGRFELPETDAVICQLEIPLETVMESAQRSRAFFSLNVAPAQELPRDLLERCDLVVMNETEAAIVGAAIDACSGWVAVTYGSRGAQLTKAGHPPVEAQPPRVDAVDTTGAGDTFTAALTLRLAEGAAPAEALEFACAAGAVATTTPGAQPSFPHRQQVLDRLESGVSI